MSKSDSPLVQPDSFTLPVGSEAWFTWLSQQTRFSFQGKNGHFTARREMRRGKPFWYAYRRRDGRLYKQYLGKTGELTAERLEQASLALAGRNLLEQYTSRPAGSRVGEDKGGRPAYAAQASQAREARVDTSFLPMTRINLPALPPHLLSRPRLARQLAAPLILIYAPSGFGKSTLLNDWKRSCAHPVAWLSLEAADNHPLHFWYSVVRALQTVHPDFGKELLAYLQTASPARLSEVISWLSMDIAGAQAAFPRLSLVLDDFHRVDHPEIYDSLQAWLERLPANLQLIIAGNTRPPFAVGELRARGLLTELDANDLRFNLEEGIAYLRQYPQDPSLAVTDLEKLVRHSEGWAAGLTLTALALGKQEDPRQFIDTFSGAHIYLRDYFMETVLQHSSAKVQEFLLKTAILKQLTGSLCDAVVGGQDGEEMLARLWQENLFIARMEEPGWYRYHDLFAEMLLGQLRAQLRDRFPGEITALHQRAAQWYREHNAPADAVYHLLAVSAWEEAAALVEAMALRELEQYGEDSRLLRWLQELPEDVVQNHKTLLFVYLRLADVALHRQKIERFIARIETNLSGKPVRQRTRDEREVLVEIQHIRRVWEQGSAFTPPAQGDGVNDARWEVLNGLRLLKQVNGPDPAWFENQATALLQKAQAQPNLFVVLMVGGVLAERAAINGQLRRSEKIARQVLEQSLAQRGKLPEPASIPLAALSQVALQRHELELAQKYLAQAQEVDPNPTSSNMLIQAGILRSLILAAQGKVDEALENIQAVRALHGRRPSGAWTDPDLLACQAFLCIRKGDLASAGQLLSEAQSAGEHALSRLALAEISLAKGQPAAAEAQLSDLIAQHPNGISFEPLLRPRVLLALALFEQRKLNQALQIISDALRAAAPERFLRPFLDNAPGLAPLLALALKTEKFTAEAQTFIKEILRLAAPGGEVSPSEIDALSTSASISPREQEVLDLLSSGYSNRDIAAKLCISDSTVKTHLGNIYAKLGVSSRTQAVRVFYAPNPPSPFPQVWGKGGKPEDDSG